MVWCCVERLERGFEGGLQKLTCLGRVDAQVDGVHVFLHSYLGIKLGSTGSVALRGLGG